MRTHNQSDANLSLHVMTSIFILGHVYYNHMARDNIYTVDIYRDTYTKIYDYADGRPMKMFINRILSEWVGNQQKEKQKKRKD